MENIINILLPHIITAIGAIGSFETVIKMINSKKYRKYTKATNKIIKILDDLLIENPYYLKYDLDNILDIAIDITNDGNITFKDYKPLKNYIIEKFDIREHQDHKNGSKHTSKEEQINKEKVKEALKMKEDN